MFRFFADNDNCITAVMTNKDGTAATGATVTALVQREGVDVSGTWPLSMPETATPGTYFGVVPASTDLVAGETVSVDIDGTGSGGETYHSEDPKVYVYAQKPS